jgi:MFS family permease
MSPVYAEAVGFSVADVATFVSVSIIGGAVIQYPLGYLSDRWNRRVVLLITSSLAMAAAIALWYFAGNDPLTNFAIVFVFGSFAMPLYSLSAAHANDHAGKNEYVLLNAGLMMFYSFGAVGGPFAASYVMAWFGPHALFQFCAAVYAALILVILYRMGVRRSVPRSQRGRFAALLRTSLLFGRLAGRAGGEKDVKSGKEKLQQAGK